MELLKDGIIDFEIDAIWDLDLGCVDPGGVLFNEVLQDLWCPVCSDQA